MRLSLDALRVIDAIDRSGSFAAAGELLFRVPSAITYSVRKLEDDLGVTLFDRSGRRAQLTPAGRELLTRGRHLLEAAEDLEDRVRRTATGWETQLRIAVDDALGVERVMPLLADFYASAAFTPRVQLMTEVFGGPLDALVADRADMAIGASGDLPTHPPLHSVDLGRMAFVFCVAADHALAAAAEPLSADVLRAQRAIVVSDTSRQLPGRTGGFLPEQDVLAVPSLSAKLAAQCAGLGVGFLPRGLAQPEIDAGRLVARTVDFARDAPILKLVWRADRPGHAIDWFVRTLPTYEPFAALLDSVADDRDHAGPSQ